MKLNQYFNSEEFDCKLQSGSGKLMDKYFIAMLTSARIEANKPFIILSGYRTPAHNEFVGGRSNSSHLTGNAADIFYLTSADLYVMIKALLAAGFTRIGIGKSFIHVDNDRTKPQNVIWKY